MDVDVCPGCDRDRGCADRAAVLDDRFSGSDCLERDLVPGRHVFADENRHVTELETASRFQRFERGSHVVASADDECRFH